MTSSLIYTLQKTSSELNRRLKLEISLKQREISVWKHGRLIPISSLLQYGPDSLDLLVPVHILLFRAEFWNRTSHEHQSLKVDPSSHLRPMHWKSIDRVAHTPTGSRWQWLHWRRWVSMHPVDLYISVACHSVCFRICCRLCSVASTLHP